MGDVSHSAKKKKSGGGQNKSYYYSLTYDEDDAGSLDDAAIDDELQRRVASILAETEIDVHQGHVTVEEADGGRLDMNDNLFGGADDDDGFRRNSRTLDFELSDEDEVEDFQSVDSKSDTFRPDLETASIEDDFVRITRPYGGGGEARRQPQPPGQGQADPPAAAASPDDDVFVYGAMTSTSSSSEQSPKATSGPVKHTGSSPLSVVYVKQKPSTELYDGNFIDDDILQPQDDRALDDNISQDLLPMPIEEMTLEMEDDDEDDGIPDASSGVDADPIIFRKSSQRWCVRHRKFVIGAALVGSLLAAGGLAAVIYFAVTGVS